MVSACTNFYSIFVSAPFLIELKSYFRVIIFKNMDKQEGKIVAR